MTIDISIVGLVNYIDKEKLEDFYGSAPGKDVIIKLEPGNVYDPRAVVTLLDGKTIGYVRKADVSDKGLFTLLTKESRHTYNAKILHKTDGYDSLVARLEYDGQLAPEVDLQEAHKNWKYTGIVLPPVPEWSELEDVMDSIMTLLERKTATSDNLQPLMEKFFRLVRYGFSKEFCDDRKMLYTMLKKHDDENLRSYATQLENVSREIHDHSVHAKAFGEIVKQMKKKIAKEHASDALNYVLSELNREMMAFPSPDLYECRRKIKYFPSRLYYEQMPREVLIKFLSGIALAGYIGKLENKGKQKKKSSKTNGKRVGKRGRPISDALPPFPIFNMIVGDESERNYWKPILIEMMQGKKTADAADVMFAAYEAGIVHTYSYKIVNESFGVGGRDGYEDEIRRLKKGVESKIVDTYITIFEQRKKERL